MKSHRFVNYWEIVFQKSTTNEQFILTCLACKLGKPSLKQKFVS